MSYSRQTVGEVVRRLRATTRVIQVVIGPRQVGKTTAAAEVEARLGWPTRSAAADDALPPGPEWIETHWQAARALPGRRVLLVLDEIQKVVGWSGVVKRLWDEELRHAGKVRVLLLGSSALLVQKGLAESLAGRFFLHRCMHWTWPECREAFGWTLAQWIFFGGWLLNGLSPTEWDIGYWRKGNAEVDYVVSRGREAFAIEVKSGRTGKVSGLDAFRHVDPRARSLLMGGGGLPLEELFQMTPGQVLGE